LERDAYKCTITGTSGADASSSALLDVTPIIPPSIDIRTLSRYAGLPSDDPLCEPTLRFYRLENMLTLDDDASDAFRSLNVWLEQTVRSIPRMTLDPPSPLITGLLLLFFFPCTFFLFIVLSLSFGAETVSLINLINLTIRNATESIKSSRGNLAPSRIRRDIPPHLRPRISRRAPSPQCFISACTPRAHAWRTNPAPPPTSKTSRGTSRG
jgi:hypothetical protein